MGHNTTSPLQGWTSSPRWSRNNWHSLEQHRYTHPLYLDRPMPQCFPTILQLVETRFSKGSHGRPHMDRTRIRIPARNRAMVLSASFRGEIPTLALWRIDHKTCVFCEHGRLRSKSTTLAYGAVVKIPTRREPDPLPRHKQLHSILSGQNRTGGDKR